MSDQLPLPDFLASLGKTEIKPGGTYATGALMRMLDFNGGDHALVIGPLAANTALFMSMTTQATTEALIKDEKEKVTEDDPSLRRRSTAKVGKAEELPFKDASFDGAMIEATLSYQLPLQQKAVLKEVARVLKPGGRIGLHEMVWRQPPTDELTDRLQTVWGGELNHYDVRGWWDLLEEAGFGEIKNELAVVSYFTRKGMTADEGEEAAGIFHSAFEDPVKLKRFADAYQEFTENRRYYGTILATAVKTA